MTVELPPEYRPSPDEEYMNPQQLEYFRLKLLAWRDELMAESQETIEHLRDASNQDVGDEADRANRESEHGLELRTRDRYRKLLRKIEQALGRIEDGSYGYCEDTGEEIGVGRLDARPIATLTVDAQERREMKEKVLADR
jgi:DnaK suppressor protein